MTELCAYRVLRLNTSTHFIPVDGAIIVARYVNQIQREKRNIRASRMSQGAFKMAPPGGRYSTIKGDDQDSIPLRPASFTRSPPHGQDEFNPYEEVTGPDYRGSSYSAYESTTYDGMPMSADLEHGHDKTNSADSATHHGGVNA